MIKKGMVALSLLTLPLFPTPEKITPEQVQNYIAQEIERQQEERIERLVWKAALASSAITCAVGLVAGIGIAFWLNRS